VDKTPRITASRRQVAASYAPPAPLKQRIMRQVGVFRGDVWWTNKIAPLLGTAYAVAVVLHVPVGALWPLLLRLLLAVIPAAAYVSVLNDLTDLEDDRRCGKPNRLSDFSPGARAGLLVVCLLLGAAGGWLLSPYPIACLFYAANWVPYTLYSAPPLRLKARGGWGVLMDACGAHLLPALWAASLIAEGTGQKLPLLFVAPLGVWSLSLGIRGILRHQMMDRERDRQAGVGTFAARTNPHSIDQLVRWGVLPAEFAGLAALLAQAGTWWPWALLVLDQLVEGLRICFLQARFTAAGPGAADRFLLAEYYELFYPLTFLLLLAQREPAGWGLAGLHLLLFSRPLRLFYEAVRAIGIQLARRHRLGRRLELRLKTRRSGSADPHDLG